VVFSPDDTAAPLVDFGVPVQVTGTPTTALGLLRRATEIERELGVTVPVGAHVLAVAAGSLGTLVSDQRLTIGGVAYRSRGPVEGPRDRWDRFVVVEVPL